MKIARLEREKETVVFHYDNNTTYTCTVSGSGNRCYFLDYNGKNSQLFYNLGIEDPKALYKKLGILTRNGVCPECKKEDIDTILNYLVKHYSVIEEPFIEESPEVIENCEVVQDEYNWLFN